MSSSKTIETMMKNIAKEQDRMLLERDFITETRQRLSFDASAYPKKARIVPIAVTAGAALAAAAAVALLMLVPSAVTVEANGISLPVGAWVASQPEQSTELRFSDGSRIHLSGSSGMRIQDLTADGARLLLERGSISVSVVHHPGTDWKLDVGPYLITVTGTRFDVAWNPELRELNMDMDEGSVRVEGPMAISGATLSAGETLRASLEKRRLEIEESESKAAVAEAFLPTLTSSDGDLSKGESDPGSSPAGDVVVRSSLKKNDVERDSWRKLARDGKYEEAVRLAEESGIERILKTGSAADLMSLGDAARHMGRASMAEYVYTAVRSRFAGTSHASAAAFDLGKMAFDRKKAYKEAAHWFSACLTDGKRGVLEREASGRLIESLDRAGDRAGAAAASRRYLDRFPDGPHAQLARTLAASQI